MIASLPSTSPFSGIASAIPCPPLEAQVRQRLLKDCFCVSAFVSSVSARVLAISARSSSSSKRAFSSSICFNSRSGSLYITLTSAACRRCDACCSFSSRFCRLRPRSVISGALSRFSDMNSYARIFGSCLFCYRIYQMRRQYAHKEKMLALIERGGEARSFRVPAVNADTLIPILKQQTGAERARSKRRWSRCTWLGCRCAGSRTSPRRCGARGFRRARCRT